MSLLELGWGPFFSRAIDLPAEAALSPARVLADHGARLVLGLEDGERVALLPSSLRGAAAVGDWVLCQPLPDGAAVLRRILPRRSALSRQAAGNATSEQLLAANLDRVLVVEPLDAGPNLRRLERMLAAVRASGAAPAVLLTKADLHPAPEEALRAAEAVAADAPVLSLSARRGEGLEAVRALLPAGQTGVLLGQSGSGKSTLLNALLGAETAATGLLTSDGRGRHVTTHRRLFRLPGGGLLVDGPGLRELQLWTEGGLEAAFADVTALSATCRFSDCTHGEEPGCAVQAAVELGRLPAERLASFLKLSAEVAGLAGRHGAAGRIESHRSARARPGPGRGPRRGRDEEES